MPLLANGISYILTYKWCESYSLKYLLWVQYLHVRKYKRRSIRIVYIEVLNRSIRVVYIEVLHRNDFL